jgi:hypothetical protein
VDALEVALGTVNGGEFLDQLSEYRLLTNDRAP